MKSTGPNTEPCGTLQVSGIGPDITPYLHRRSGSGHASRMKTNPLHADSRTPKRGSRTVSSVQWSTVSNAELKSSSRKSGDMLVVNSSYKVIVHAEHCCLGRVASAVR